MFDNRPQRPIGTRPRLSVVDASRPAPAPSIDAVTLLGKRVAAGEFDGQPHQLGQAIARRLYLLSVLDGLDVRRGFVVGDRVVIRPTVRPRYVHGNHGTLEFWIGSRVVVRLDHPIGRFVDGRIRCTPDGLEKLGAG